MTDHGVSTDEIRASFAAGYDLERELLGGGMSRVFLATERALGRKVVIKVLPPELAAGVNKERFRREVQLAAQLQHPHIVPLYSAGSQGEVLYYTMPFIEGESLKHALQEKKRLSPREVLRVLHDVVDALGYAHARGVIHRDIKPGNVLRSGNHAVVTDFGVAKAISVSSALPGMTTSGMVVGSPAYMAPEQLAGDPNADHRIDIYAVGLLAYELLTGDTPFHSLSPQETMAAQLTRTPMSLDKVRRDVPPALSAIIMKCLQKRPDDRWNDAAELLAALDSISVPSGEFSAGTVGRRPWALLAAAGVILASIAVWQKAQSPAAPIATPRDTVTISPAGPLLTRAESLAIAKAVDSRVEEERAIRRAKTDSLAKARAGANPGTSATAPAPVAMTAEALNRMADSMRNEIQRAIFDSLARMQQSAMLEGGRRGGRGPGAQSFGGREGLLPPPGSGRGPDPRIVIQGANSNQRVIQGLGGEIDSLLRAMEFATRGTRVGALDPVNFARRAATMGPPRRIVITEPRPSRSTEHAMSEGARIADALRNAFAANKRYIVAPRDSVRAALEKTRTIDDLAPMLNADLFVNISVSRRGGGDSVHWQVTTRDLGAHGAYSLRSYISPPGAPRPAPSDLDSLVAKALVNVSEMDRAPRKPPPEDAPGGPLSKEAFAARAESMGPPRRLIVWTHPRDPNRPDIEAAGNVVADALRKSFTTIPRYVVVSTDETTNALAKSRDREDVARNTRAELMLTIRGGMSRDSIQYTVTAWDLGAHRSYEQRSMTAGRVSLGSPTANIDSLFRLSAKHLETLDKAPRRPPER
jgi:predicted Ser/Thr protein kinase